MSAAITLDDIIVFLLETSMFSVLSAEELSDVVQIMQVQRLGAGEYVFHQGEQGDAWYVVYEGEVDVIVAKEGEERVIASIGPRTCFGEMAILDGFSRSAGVRTQMGVTVFRFPREAFNGLRDQENLAAYKLIHQISLVLVARQRDATKRLAAMNTKALATEVADVVESIVRATKTSG